MFSETLNGFFCGCFFWEIVLLAYRSWKKGYLDTLLDDGIALRCRERWSLHYTQLHIGYLVSRHPHILYITMDLTFEHLIFFLLLINLTILHRFKGLNVLFYVWIDPWSLAVGLSI